MNSKGSAFAAEEVAGTRAARLAHRSYMPSWIINPKWLQSVEIPSDYARELLEEVNDATPGALVRSLIASRPPASEEAVKRGTDTRLPEIARRTMVLWDADDTNGRWKDEDGVKSSQESLMLLLSDTIKSVTQRTPWDPAECGTEMRKVMLKVLLKRFLNQSLDPTAVGLFAKDVLRRATDADIPQEVQYLYVAFTHDNAWNGRDSYRREENFIRREDFMEFQEKCLEEVGRRLHLLNMDLTTMGANANHAVMIWKEIHGDCRMRCFGGSITLSLSNLRLRVVGGRKRKLPKNLEARWCLERDGRTVCSVAVPQKGILGNGEYRWKSDSRVTLIAPTDAHSHFEGFTIALELTVSKTSCFCSVPRERVLAFAVVSVDKALYTGVDLLNSPLRTAAIRPPGEPFAEKERPTVGYHFSSLVLSTSNDTSQNPYPCVIDATTGWCSMCCLNQAHNMRPPAIDVEEYVAAAGAGAGAAVKSHVTVNLNMWSRDHHSSFLRLVDVLGDIDDIGTAILKAYCRRYLIHSELESVALLVSVCMRSNLTDRAARELISLALASLRNLKGTLTTCVGERLVAEAIETTRSHIFDIILSLEDLVPSSTVPHPRDAAELLEGVKSLLVKCGEGNVSEAITREAQKDAKQLADALQKLDGRLLRENRRTTAMVRETATDLVLSELECHEDQARLTGKARYLLELLTRCTERLRRAFLFAKSSESPSVQAVAQTRIESVAFAICTPLRNVVMRIFACLVRAPEPDPFGDTLGLLVETYGSLACLVEILSSDPNMTDICTEFSGCFMLFLSSWLPLCEGRISAWIAGIVKNEPLEPILRGTVHFNHSVSLLQDLLLSLLAVFLRILGWSDPIQRSMYAIHFFGLVQRMGEAFVDAVVAQGRTASRLEEWMVCLSILQRYQVVMRELGDKEIKTRLVDIVGDPERMMEHQRRVIAEQTRASTLETANELVRHVQHVLEQTTLSFLSGITDADTLMKTTSDLSVSEMRSRAQRLSDYVRLQMQLAKDNLDVEVFNVFFDEIALRAYYGAFHHLVLRNTTNVPLPKWCVALLLQLLHAVDAELESVGEDVEQTDPLTSRQRSVRVLIVLSGEPSQALIEIAGTEKLDNTELGQVMLILRSRTDSVAKQYIKQISSS